MICSIQELVIDLLQSIVEIVTYGDRQDPMIFEYELIMIQLSLRGYGSEYLNNVVIATFKILQMFHGIPSFSRICSCAKNRKKCKDRGTIATVPKHNDSKYG